MPKLQISFACCPYDRLNPIISGRVPVEGCDVNFFPLRPEELFPRVYQTQDFDVTELSASSHILTSLRGDANYLGIPAFVSRVFRHGDIYIRTDRGIRTSAGPARQGRRRAGISDDRGALDPRHSVRRIRRQDIGDPLAQRRAAEARPRRSGRRSRCRRASS